MMFIVGSLLAVGIVWGVTNVLMKRGSAGINELPPAQTALGGLFRDLIFLLSRPLYVASFIGNLCGSVLFYFTLSKADVSLVGPIVNSLTFICTSAAGKLLNEESLSSQGILGMALVGIGVAVCVQSKVGL